ncbi:MAG TPA: nitroreductase family protein [Thermoanaerobaculaceae bacterium]|nr:nitroreductase family protein [Thermoanaerobaculaceae bacterium]HRS14760.1 nitroreductase family protein [Thermoanaerobaculaceae bacterium]
MATAAGAASLPLQELVRYATLAPSSHNTQCWRFVPCAQAVSILPDLERRCPVVDPDDHHLFVSLGCAAENLIQAAAGMGFRGECAFGGAASEGIEITLTPVPAVHTPLFEAIPARQSTRCEYDGRPVSNHELRLLEEAGKGAGVRVLLVTDRQIMERVLALVIEGNTAQMRNPDFVRELKQWLRYNGKQAARLGDGLYVACSGNPTAPAWLGSLLFDLFFKPGAENDRYARHLRSSAGVAVFVSDRDDREHWIEAGRAFERFALQATALGLRTAHLNQPVEVASLRPSLAETIGAGTGRPDLVIRFGRGPQMPRSFRRPVTAVLLPS